MEELDFQ